MTQAILLHAPGGPEALRFEAHDMPPPGPGEVTLRQSAIGLNFIDIYYRTGLYALSATPAILGMEAAGVIEAVGQGVSDFAPGDRVAYVDFALGAYTERRNIAATKLVKLPENVSEEIAAAALVKGLTAWYLLTRTYQVGPQTTLLATAAVGGVGSLLVPWAKHVGARVIGVVGGPEKAARARELGCDHVIDYRADPIAARARELTQGRGVDVVYDSVGAATWEASLDSLRPLGMMVSYGNASGPVPPFAPLELSRRGSLFFTRPSLKDYLHFSPPPLAEKGGFDDSPLISPEGRGKLPLHASEGAAGEGGDVHSPAPYREAAGEVLGLIAQGVLKPLIGQRYALRDASDAHRDLEAGKTVGASLLLP